VHREKLGKKKDRESFGSRDVWNFG
jgi:hypothetical protein